MTKFNAKEFALLPSSEQKAALDLLFSRSFAKWVMYYWTESEGSKHYHKDWNLSKILDLEMQKGGIHRNMCDLAQSIILNPDIEHEKDVNKRTDMLMEWRRALAVEAPRGFIKSTLFSRLFPIYLACYPKLLRRPSAIVASETVGFANTLLKGTDTPGQLELVETNIRLHSDFGMSAKYKEGELVISTKRGDFIIMAKGLTAQVRGPHPGIIIVDDAEGNEGAYSAIIRKKVKHNFDTSLLPMRDSRDHYGIRVLDPFLLTGTILHNQCLLASVIKEPDTGLPRPGFVTHSFKALLGEGDTEYLLKHGRPSWNKRNPIYVLAARAKSMGITAFNQEYMGAPLTDATQIFYRVWLRRFATLPIVDVNGETIVYHYIVGVDPSSTEKEMRDRSQAAVVIAAIITDGAWKGRTYIVDAKQGFWTTERIIDEVIAARTRYSPSRPIDCVVENAAGQKHLKVAIRERSLRTGVQNINVFLSPADTQKQRRAMQVQFWVERGNVYIKNTDSAFFEEIVEFPNHPNDDRLDAFVYILRRVVSVFAGPGKEPEKQSAKESFVQKQYRLIKEREKRSNKHKPAGVFKKYSKR